MLRKRTFAIVLLALIGAGALPAAARDVMRLENPWNPRHIAELPSDIRAAVADENQTCGGAWAAEHAFTRYIQGGAPAHQFIALHFEHFHCGGAAARCTDASCLHQVFVSSDGHYRLVLSTYVRELELKKIGNTPVVELACASTNPHCARVLRWNGTRFVP
jgi:hypothetical protein